MLPVECTANDGGVIPPYILTSWDRTFIHKCVDTILLVSRIYGFNDVGFKTKRMLDGWKRASLLTGGPFKYAKWLFAAYYSYHKKQEIPTFPREGEIKTQVLQPVSPNALASGRLYRWISIMKNSDPSMFDSYLTSLLYIKKGLPRPHVRMVREAEKKSFEKLTSKPLMPPSVIRSGEKYAITDDIIRSKMKRIIDEVFDGVSYTVDDRIEPFFPSTSANYLHTRGLGGAVGTILDHPDLLKGLRDESTLVEVDRRNVNDADIIVYDDIRLRDRFRFLYNRILIHALREEPLAVPQGLPESLKTRVISKGPPLLYTAMKPLQRKLWSSLFRHRTFELIGKPVNGSILSRVFHPLTEADDASFISCDYSDATNEMFSKWSDFCADLIIKKLDLTLDESYLVKRALTNHIVMLNGEKRVQERGQLMGSVLSFPILCLVNATLCSVAMMSQYGDKPLKELPLLVNGDDAVFTGNSEVYSRWLRAAKLSGMAPSIGKVYYSKEFFNINSLVWRMRSGNYEKWVESPFGLKIIYDYWEFVPYVNLGLLNGTKRSSSHFDSFGDIGSRSVKLVELCPPALAERTLRQFLYMNLKELSSAQAPWFIPKRFGGLGLCEVGSLKARDLDRRFLQKAVDGQFFDIPTPSSLTVWKTWNLAARKIKPLLVEPFSEPVSRSHNFKDLNGRLCVALLFDTSVRLSDIYSEMSSVKPHALLMKYYQSLRKYWRSVRKSPNGLPSRFSDYGDIRLPVKNECRSVFYTIEEAVNLRSVYNH